MPQITHIGKKLHGPTYAQTHCQTLGEEDRVIVVRKRDHHDSDHVDDTSDCNHDTSVAFIVQLSSEWRQCELEEQLEGADPAKWWQR